MSCSWFSTVATCAKIGKTTDPLQSSYYIDNSEFHWYQPLNKLHVVTHLLTDSRINRNWCQQCRKHQPRHPGATLRGTQLEMSHGRLTWYWGDKHCEGPTLKEAEECQRNVASYRIKLFWKQKVRNGTEQAALLLPLAQCKQEQKWKEMPTLICAEMSRII